MPDNTNDPTVNDDSQPKLNTDYYDEVDEDAYEQSRHNVSAPDRESRALWQSTTISTDENGPRVEDAVPAFAEFRAQALANPVLADGDIDDEARAANQDAADAAAAKAQEIWDSPGYAAQTGAEAGQYDDPKLEGQVPAENFSAAPEANEDERLAEDAAADEADRNNSGSVYTDDTSVGNSDPNGVQVTSDDKKEELKNDQAPSFSDANPDNTQSDLVSDTAGEQGGLDETSADDATAKKTSRGRKASAGNDQSNTEAEAPESTSEAPTSN